MPSSIAPNSVARNRFPAAGWRCIIALAGATLLAACGGSPSPAAPAASPPTALSYDSPQALYVANEAITPNLARLSGGAADSFSVTPALPSGLNLDSRTGAVSGTPTALHSLSSHTVTARNSAGSVQAALRLAVTARGSWSAAATVPLARYYASIAALASGEVLVAGGISGAGVTASAQLYHPATDSWSAALSMSSARYEGLAVRLSDGRVLVAGGQTSVSTTTALAEIYDPAFNTWTATGSMNQARTRASAHLLPDGKVLVVGGYSTNGTVTFSNTAEVYDPALGTWSQLPTLLSARRGQHGAELLPGGTTLLVAGGINSLGFVTTAELYAVDGTGTTPIAFGGSGNVTLSTQLSDGSVLVISDGSTTARRFDPATSTWANSTMNSARQLPTMTLLADGRVLVAGGLNLNSAETYHPDFNVWTTAAPMASVRRGAVATRLGNGQVLVVSGTSGAGDVNASERYTP